MVRLELRRWSKSIIVPQEHGRLARLAIRAKRPKPCENVVLWIDSSDFRVKGKRSLSKKKQYYAKKLKSPGRRWVMITNVKGQVQWISNWNLPTTYDSHIVAENSKVIKKLFSGLTIVGDHHFRAVSTQLKKITLITPKSRAGRRKKVNGMLVPRELSPEDEAINEVISMVRGKVEAPYGWVKARFSALSKPFYENGNQHDCLIRHAFACHRLMISNQ